MMITKLFTLLFSFAMLAASAQQDYKSIIASIFKNAETDFVNIIGGKLPDLHTEHTFHDSTLKIREGRNMIVKKNNADIVFFMHLSSYSDVDLLEEALDQYVEENFPDSKFDKETRDLGFDGYFYQTMIYRKDENLPFMIYSVDGLDTDIVLSVFGKSSDLNQ